MSVATLYYLIGRGRGEPIRMLLNFLDIDYKDEYITSKQALIAFNQKKLNPFQQIPVLEIDGQHLVQCQAIINHLARKHNLYGDNAEQAYQCDKLAGALADWQTLSFKAIFNPDNQAVYFSTQLPKMLNTFEKLLKSERDYLVNEKINFPDILLFEQLLNQLDFRGKNLLSDYPKLTALVARLKQTPTLTNYLTSERRHEFPSVENDYVNRVLAIFT